MDGTHPGPDGCEHPDKAPEDAHCGGTQGMCIPCKAAEQREAIIQWGRTIMSLSEDGTTALAVDGSVLGEVLGWTGPNPGSGILNTRMRMFDGSYWTGRARGLGGQMNGWAYRDQVNNPATTALKGKAK